MDIAKKIGRIFIYLVVILVQIIMTQVVTFLVSLIFPVNVDPVQTQPVLITIIIGLAYAVGVFWPGWLAIRQHWLPLSTKYPVRFLGALVGGYIPLFAALLIYRGFESGNPFFLFAVLGSVIGFYMLGWEEKNKSDS